MAKTPEMMAHQEWLGYVQPTGLVVSIPAMLAAQAHINKNIAPNHRRFLSCLPRDKNDDLILEIKDFPEFTQTVLDWEEEDLVGRPGGESVPTSLEVTLPEYNETLQPTYAVKEFEPKDPGNPWLMLIQELPAATELDSIAEQHDRCWHASPHAKFERLLRETQVPLGILTSGTHLRLVYAPHGETSGYMTFSVSEMVTVAGRPIFASLHMLLCAERLFSLPEKQRLPAIMSDSRKYQNVVSTKLAEQVLAALNELLRGFQAANDQRKGILLRELLAEDPNHGYAGLLTVLLRLVFIFYAEDRGLLSSDSVYTNFYSVTGLFDRLRADAGRFPDTMDQRYGAWAQLLTLFRLIFEGGSHGDFQLPARKGYLFDPDRYPFLEGRQWKSGEQEVDTPDIPQVSDGVVFRMLQNLLVLDGERLSYRTLDVEQIGSVYETVMGFNLEVAQGKSIAIKPTKSHGAPTTIDLEALLEAGAGQRVKWIKDNADQKISGQVATALKKAESIEDLLAALDKKIAKKVTPNVVPKGAMVLQPSDERRRSGSHYTPRSLTEPIVRTTLEPILKQLADPEADLTTVYVPSREDKRRYTKGELAARIRLSEKAVEAANKAREIGTPHPSQILDLKICDPAMGSGAFLVETCRKLGDELIKAWYAHDLVPTDIPLDEDEVLYARRLIAQRCLYGVDKNQMAVDLAKLSLWLATLAKNHPFTFLDHSLRHGDSLVGLTRRQIIGFHWEPKKQKQLGEDLIQRRLDRATEARVKILNAREDVPYRDQEQRLAVADEALNVARMTGDACVSAFFAGSKKKEREERCDELFGKVSDWYASGHDINKRGPIAETAAQLQSGEHPIPPFHWEIEFPEVFTRNNGGFDAFVGNPPFAGRITSSLGNRNGYIDWLKALHPESHGNADLVAHFFRRTFSLVRESGTLGLIASNTIRQGDTRSSGLRWMCNHNGAIYSARRRVKWPGQAAVIVCVVHVQRSSLNVKPILDGRDVDQITAYLFHAGGHEDPQRLQQNAGKGFQGCIVVGMGFTFDDTDRAGITSPISLMNELLEKDPRNSEVIFPYLGGEELNDSPTHSHHRYVIHFGERDEEDCRRNWPDVMKIVEEKVKPQRIESAKGGGNDKKKRAEKWWQFARTAKDLQEATVGMDRVLAVAFVSKWFAPAFVPCTTVVAGPAKVIAIDNWAVYGVLQSRVHEVWARFLSSTLKDDLNYSLSDAFSTFPFPSNIPIRSFADDGIEELAETYYRNRATEMVASQEGLTKTYNRFHDPHEKSVEIQKLRELHDAMDRAVLEAYGWDDLAKTARCEFLLDYEEEDDENESGKKSKRKKPWRLRWPDEFRDEVLARLLELNEKRAEEERLAGTVGEGKGSNHSKTDKRKTLVKQKPTTPDLFSDPDGRSQ